MVYVVSTVLCVAAIAAIMTWAVIENQRAEEKTKKDYENATESADICGSCD